MTLDSRTGSLGRFQTINQPVHMQDLCNEFTGRFLLTRANRLLLVTVLRRSVHFTLSCVGSPAWLRPVMEASDLQISVFKAQFMRRELRVPMPLHLRLLETGTVKGVQMREIYRSLSQKTPLR